MPSLEFSPNITAPTAGSGATKALVAASSGNAIVLYQVVIETTNTTTDNVIFQDGSGGTTLLNVQLPINTTLVLPCTGAEWARTTIGNGLFFVATANTVITAYYLYR